MALIQCPECKQSISDKANVCIHCGYPINYRKQNRITKNFKRNPNGFGQIRKLSGNRRRPYAVYPPVSEYNPVTGSPISRPAIGYYETYQEAQKALVLFNEKPYDMTFKDATLKQVFDSWSDNNFKGEYSQHTKNTYITGINHLKSLWDMPLRKLSSNDFQNIIDNVAMGSQMSVLLTCRKVLNYANVHDIINKDYSSLLSTSKNLVVQNGVPFYEDELRKLYEHIDEREVQLVFCLILTGLRRSEVQTAEVYLEEGYIRGGIKTDAGKNRIIPIHPFIEQYIKDGIFEQFKSSNTIGKVFRRTMQRLDLYEVDENTKHTPHDCRHTFSWLCDKFEVKSLAKYKMIGHKTNEVDIDVYGHQTLDELKAEINKIKIGSLLNL